MKQWGAFALTLMLLGAALVTSQKQKIDAPVGPEAVLSLIADTEHELTRLPVSFTRMSDVEEIKIGNQLASEYGGEGLFAKSFPRTRVVQVYVNRVGARVAVGAHRKLPYQFHYISDPDFINAFALPGGHVFIGGGLMALMDSEDELASVLGHEVEHIDHYHCAERVQTQAALQKVPLGALVAIPVEVFEAGYSKTQELEADREGTRLAVKARYSPLGAVRMFQTFDRLYQERTRRAQSPAGRTFHAGARNPGRLFPLAPAALRAHRADSRHDLGRTLGGPDLRATAGSGVRVSDPTRRPSPGRAGTLRRRKRRRRAR